jgi:uncharacterized protein
MRIAAPAATLAALALAVGGCVSTGAGFGQGPVRICDEKGCQERPSSHASFTPTDDRSRQRQADPDAYRGESVSQLEAEAGGGDARAAYRLGLVHQAGIAGTPRNARLAAQYFERAAIQQHAWAQFRLSEMYAQGQGIARNPGRASELAFAAARNGHAQAANNVGLAYLQGRGLPADSVEGARFLTIAAENGVPEAQYNLGLMYFRGEGVARQLHDGLQWMRKSAEGGYFPAQKAVGRLYMTGLDNMGQDVAEAKTWLQATAAKGDAESRRWLVEIERAERQEREYQRELQMLSAQTALYIAGAIFAAALAPPPVYVVYY